MNKLTEKRERDRWYVRNSRRMFSSVFSKEGVLPAQAHGNPLVISALRVARAQGFRLRLPSGEALTTSPDPLRLIAKESGVMLRPVDLTDGWQRQDHGVLLAFTQDELPVALLPAKRGYDIWYPEEDAKRCHYTGEVSFTKAYQIYTPFPAQPITRKKMLRFFFSFTGKADFAWVFLLALAAAILSVVPAAVTQTIFNTLIPLNQMVSILLLCAVLFIFAFSRGLLDIVKTFCILRIKGRASNMQNSLLSKLLELPATFFRRYTSGELAMRSTAFTSIQKTLSTGVVNALLGSLFSIVNGLYLFSIDATLGFVAFILAAVGVLISASLGFVQLMFQRLALKQNNQISGFVLQIISAVPRLRVSGALSRAFHEWSRKYTRQRKLEYRKSVMKSITSVFTVAWPTLCLCVLFYLAYQQNLPAGSFIALNSTFLLFISAMLQLVETVISVNGIFPLYESAKPIMEELPETDSKKIIPSEITGAIEANHLSFQYFEDGAIILNDLTFSIEPGEYVAIVGTSGSGKSTLLRLLLGLEKPTEGHLTVGGYDLASVEIRTLRRYFGVVLQNSQLLPGDIMSNLSGVQGEISLERAWELLRTVGMEEEVRAMPMGLHTMVAEGARTLSGGQRQKLLIARALASEPSILFLDEATSALDNISQKRVSDSLKSQKITRVVIAHRLSTIIECNRIIVLEKGSIVEEGSYDELIQNEDGHFFRYAKRQLL